MATRTSSTIETGRTYDVDFLNWENGVTGEGLLTFGNRTKKTTGVVKATNRFIKVFFTRVGSDPFDLNSGTSFEDIYYMGGSSIPELRTFINIQINTALTQIKTLQASNSFPTDENITSVTLLGVDKPAADKMTMNLNILTEAGSSVTVKLPIVGG